MLLCLDVGNSQILGGVYDGEELKATFRRTSSIRASSDEFGTFFRAVLRENEVDPEAIDAAAVCSVVPDIVHSLRNTFRKYFRLDPFVLQPGARTGLKIRYRNPLEVGADKIANAIGGLARFPKRNLIIVDFGTATTLCAVTAGKEYLGGIITPGIHTSMEMLESKTARLPAVEIVRPAQVLGRSMVESIQAGLYHGTLATVRALAEMVTAEHFAQDPPVILGTGGFGRLFADEKFFDAFLPAPADGLAAGCRAIATGETGRPIIEMLPLLELAEDGLYCPSGNFHIDPWAPVERAVVTHAHSDHARPGARAYLAARPGEALLRARLGPEAAIEALDYGAPVSLNGVRVSLHPAGHILGSAQVRIEQGGEVWVVSGDYKLAPDPTCAPFEPLRCHTFVTESTFGLPIFRWPVESEVVDAIHAWWRANQEAGRASLLFAHPLGKAQRLLALLDSSIGPIYTHGAMEQLTEIYRAQGVALAPTTHVGDQRPSSQALIVAPPSAHGSPWERRFGSASTAFASGWMRIRGTRRRRSLDRGFVLSDHADWSAPLRAIDATGAESVWVTHGYRAPLVRWLAEHGRQARMVETRFEEDEP